MIPAELGKLVNLQTLNLGVTRLVGTIPAELGSLVNLRTLNLSYNSLNGVVPSEFGNLVNLKFLSLGGRTMKLSNVENAKAELEAKLPGCNIDIKT